MASNTGMQRGSPQATQRGQDGRQMAAPGTPTEALRRELGNRRKRLLALFPGPNSEGAVNRMCAMAVIQYEKALAGGANPSMGSVVDEIVKAAQYGLEIVGDQAYLVCYGAKAELIVGPGGLITMANREGIVAYARCVFDGDEFDYDLGTGWVHHKKTQHGRRPADREDTEKRITHVWAKATKIVKKDEQAIPILEVLTAEDIAFYRSFSQAKSTKSPWYVHFEGMARKTGLKRAMSYAPKSMILTWALAETETGGALPILDVDADPDPADQRGNGGAISDEEHARRIDRGEEPAREPGEDG